ncbi:uncharacterized protein FOMMEDRAFT_162710 [Fomitiporia mediterranea MF3/22]|uniref:Cyanovirin-N domain-containing protein n=1 Tax=Fomitiporia mediterranea (strain MF3/22) TaxID=694068 RepID=R7SG47_FOMME|nr:uncharacterized protein FOMMEDRAFT_162710 [Fomitiporia mediterranea MF3/22]EJC97688.1 hypothetical protein FOMMEDRAFT_162710 [Fomitiporia mediterranea MF3/22]
MRFLNTQIVVFACVLSAHALISRAVPKSVIDSCPSAQEESSTSILINGEEIIHQSFTCPDGKFDDDPTSRRDYNAGGGSLWKRSSLEARDTIDCEFPQLMPECQCGREFSCICFEGDVAPEEFDCTQLLNMVTSANEDAQTFTVAANGADVISLRTCALIFVNNQDIAVDYCWDNLVSQIVLSVQNLD